MFELLGKITAALLAIAAALYGIQRTLKRDRHSDEDLTLLGRGKKTLFEQYDGLIERMQTQSERQANEVDRMRNAMADVREQMTLLHKRILELDIENKVARKSMTMMLNDIRGIKEGKVRPETIDTGIYNTVMPKDE